MLPKMDCLRRSLIAYFHTRADRGLQIAHNISCISRCETLCGICVKIYGVQIPLTGKHALDRADRTAPTEYHELNRTDLP